MNDRPVQRASSAALQRTASPALSASEVTLSSRASPEARRLRRNSMSSFASEPLGRSGSRRSFSMNTSNPAARMSFSKQAAAPRFQSFRAPPPSSSALSSSSFRQTPRRSQSAHVSFLTPSYSAEVYPSVARTSSPAIIVEDTSMRSQSQPLSPVAGSEYNNPDSVLSMASSSGSFYAASRMVLASPSSSPRRSSVRSHSPSSALLPSPSFRSSVGFDRVKVAVRVRPFNLADGGDQTEAISVSGKTIFPNTERSEKLNRSYTYDHVFTEGQDEVYATIGVPMLENLLSGYNVCLFAYGQTGSGKTHSMLGFDGDEGIIPRICKDLIQRIQEMLDDNPNLTVRIVLSYMEIYREKVRDLLERKRPGEEPTSLDIYERDGKVFVKNLSIHPVINYVKIAQLIAEGNTRRQMCPTNMNETSSRSHSILQLNVIQTFDPPQPGCRDIESTLSLVDLAGSERVSKSELAGLQFEESRKINQSLLTLGRCLNYFSQPNHADQKVPFLRASKLTRLLSDCFGGNSLTWMLATVSPSVYNFAETMSTLEYALHAKHVTNNAKINRVERATEIHELQQRVQYLNDEIDRLLAERQEQVEQQAHVLCEEWSSQGKERIHALEADRDALQTAMDELTAENDKLKQSEQQALAINQVLKEELTKYQYQEKQWDEERTRQATLLRQQIECNELLKQKVETLAEDLEKKLLSAGLDYLRPPSRQGALSADAQRALREKLLEDFQVIHQSADALTRALNAQHRELHSEYQKYLQQKSSLLEQRDSLHQAEFSLTNQLSSSRDEVFRHIEMALKDEVKQLRERNTVLSRLLNEQKTQDANAVSERQRMAQLMEQMQSEREQMKEQMRQMREEHDDQLARLMDLFTQRTTGQRAQQAALRGGGGSCPPSPFPTAASTASPMEEPGQLHVRTTPIGSTTTIRNLANQFNGTSNGNGPMTSMSSASSSASVSSDSAIVAGNTTVVSASYQSYATLSAAALMDDRPIKSCLKSKSAATPGSGGRPPLYAISSSTISEDLGPAPFGSDVLISATESSASAPRSPSSAITTSSSLPQPPPQQQIFSNGNYSNNGGSNGGVSAGPSTAAVVQSRPISASLLSPFQAALPSSA